MATIVLVGGVLAAATAIGGAGRAVERARLLSGAVALAEYQLEAASAVTNNMQSNTNGDSGPYHWEQNYSQPAQAVGAGLLTTVQIRVTWHNQGNDDAFVLSKTFLARSASGE